MAVLNVKERQTVKQPEARLKERVIQDLKQLPDCWVVKVQQVVIRGTPDLLCCICGFFVALELKRNARARLDPLQAYQLAKIKNAGGIAHVVHPDNWEEILDELRALTPWGSS